jgi:hypothetical protein
MRFDFQIGHECFGAHSGAIDDQRAVTVDLVEVIQTNSDLNFSAGATEARGQIIEIDRGVRQWNNEHVSACKAGRKGGRSEPSRS